MFRLLSVLAVSIALSFPLAAATIAVVPLAVNPSYDGLINLNITGLAPGQNVRLQKFLDLHGNGSIDAADPILQELTLRDGQVSVIGGVRNRNAPGDEDGQMNGQITARIAFQLQPESHKAIGKYLYRATPLATGASPGVVAFAVNQIRSNSRIIGQVRYPGGALAQALVSAVDLNKRHLRLHAYTDTNGHFSLNVSPGVYALTALKNGFTFSSSNTVQAVITNTSMTVSNTILLAAGDRTVNGRLTDNATGSGIPGVQFRAEANNGALATIFLTDTNGAFRFAAPHNSLDVTLEGAVEDSSMLGYLRPIAPPTVNVSSGNITNLALRWSRANAMVYGTIKNQTNQPIGKIWARAANAEYEGIGLSDSAGNYSVALGTGQWELDFTNLGLAGLLGSGASISLGAGQALQTNFIFRSATARLKGVAVDQNSQPLAHLHILVSGTNQSAFVETDLSGRFDLPAAAGSWSLELDKDQSRLRGLLGPVLTLNVSDGVDVTNLLYVARRATVQLAGTVKDNAATTIAGVTVFAFGNLNGENYYAITKTDATGRFQIGLIDGTWFAGVDGNELNQRGFNGVPLQSIALAGANKTLNFVAQRQVVTGLQIDTVTLPPGTITRPYDAGLTVSGGAAPYVWSLAPGSSQLPPGLSLSTSGRLQGTPVETGLFHIVIRATDQPGRFADRAFSIQVRGLADVLRYELRKERSFVQTATNLVTAEWAFRAQVNLFESNSATAATVILPDQRSHPLSFSMTRADFLVTFTNETALRTEFPAGMYRFEIATRNDGAKSLGLNLPEAQFPAPLEIESIERLYTFNPSNPFTLSWRRGAAGSNESISIQIRNKQTGLPVYSAQLGQATNNQTVLPSGTFVTNEVYEGELILRHQLGEDTSSYPGAVGSVAAATITQFEFTTSGGAPDVQRYSLVKGQRFVQAGTAPPGPASTPFYFLAEVRASGPETVRDSTLRTPSGIIYPLSKTGDRSHQFGASFNTLSGLDATFPSGAFLFNLATAHDQSRAPLLSLASNLYPSTPKVLNLAASSSVDPRVDFTLAWEPMNGGLSSDLIQFTLEDASSNLVFATAGYGELGALDGRAAQLTVPAGFLSFGSAYIGRLTFGKTFARETNSYPGALGWSAYAKTTSFEVKTMTRPPIRFESTAISNGNFIVQLTGAASQDIELQVSPDLHAWTPLFATNSPEARLTLAHPIQTNLPAQFLRVIVLE